MSENKSSGGIGFTGCLTIAFIVLKLCDVITWSWWWVLSPIWITIGVVLLVLAGYGLYYFFSSKALDKKIAENEREFKSKWMQRMEEMKKRQKSEAN